MTILTYYDEGNGRAGVTADIVYLSNPQVQVMVRLMATVTGSSIGTAKPDTEELLQLRHGGRVDELNFAKQHQRLHDLRNTCNDIASGRSTNRYKGPSVERWGKMILVLRRRPDENRKDRIIQPIRAEVLKEDRVGPVDARDTKAGDIVDVPVWMDVWYGGGGIIVHPWAFMLFDRVVIVDSGKKDVPT